MSDLPRADLIWQNSWSFARTCALAAAVEVDLFAAFADGPADAAELARRTGTSERGIAALAGALAGMDLLDRDEAGRFSPTRIARAWLGPDAACDLGPMILHSKNLAGRWLRLGEAVRSGEPLPRPQGAGDGNSFFNELVRQLFNSNFAAAEVLADTLAERENFHPAAVLDVGAGAAPWSIPFARRNDDCRVTVIDYPEVLGTTREYAERFGVADRYELRGADAESADPGVEQFDLVLVGHVYHSMGPAASADFAVRAARSLRSGGLLAVAEFVVDNDRQGPAIPLLFACNMLLATERGTTFTADEIDGFARDAGLTPIDPIEVPTGSPIRLARKA